MLVWAFRFSVAMAAAMAYPMAGFERGDMGGAVSFVWYGDMATSHNDRSHLT